MSFRECYLGKSLVVLLAAAVVVCGVAAYAQAQPASKTPPPGKVERPQGPLAPKVERFQGPPAAKAGHPLGVLSLLAPPHAAPKPPATFAPHAGTSAILGGLQHAAQAKADPWKDIGKMALEVAVDLLSGNRTELLSGNSPKLLSEIAPWLLSGNRTKLLSEIEPKLLSGNKTDLLSGNKPELLSGNKTELLSGNKPEVLSGNKAALFNGNRISIFSNIKIEIRMTNSGNNNKSP